MVIGQDWASEQFLTHPRYNTPERIEGRQRAGQDEYLPTNRRLKALLQQHFGMSFSQTYATDVSVFIKPGNMTGNVPMSDMLYCAEKYTLPQMKAVRPVMAICLGAKTFNSLERALNLVDLKLDEASIPHTGGLGHANSGGKEKVDQISSQLATRIRGIE